MKLVLQRVQRATVRIDEQVVGAIQTGLLIFVGAEAGDDEATAQRLAAKVAKLRIFADEAGKMNRNITQAQGAILSVSQFTLLADLHHGNRPSFQAAGDPQAAHQVYTAFNEALVAQGLSVATGQFGADMQVELVNDGPATFLLNDRESAQ
ncbi:D-aminoacyl-tRNA deacylase [Fructilactobacillus myrtifloralis]|uniref:D-aminoacyl-tRNA deacylase n=1 Tax=Fructilactobacillus myrtifloralis TaxID=2940301 RepID=A0ABY5BS42_9LACO|nr:D-aminoacyl-tRNA deacylase [Fructilactobacillus myrtifloralis]USS85406.1 D-aminoacyl-tRNA deacylase [Fructilactobacillus myrtifloralis]